MFNFNKNPEYPMNWFAKNASVESDWTLYQMNMIDFIYLHDHLTLKFCSIKSEDCWWEDSVGHFILLTLKLGSKQNKIFKIIAITIPSAKKEVYEITFF